MGAVRTKVASMILCVIALVAVSAPPAMAAAPAVGFKASLNGRDISSVDDNTPLVLNPDQDVIVNLTVTNNGPSDLSIRSVNLNGKVIGLTFFSFETRIDLIVAPGETATRMFAIELIGLKGQATGFVPGALNLLGNQRQVISTRGFAINVRGSMWSVYGIFGLLVAAITALLLAGALIRLAGERLPPNRWTRATYFGVPGLGVGLTLTFSLSAFRALLPKPASWLTIVFLSTVILFAIGYLTPTPGGGRTFVRDDEEAVEAPSRAMKTVPAP